MKKTTALLLLLIGGFFASAQPTKAQWDAFLLTYKADSTYKGLRIRTLEKQTSWFDPKYFALTSTKDKSQDSVRLIVSNLPAGGGTVNIAPLQKTLDSLVGQFVTFKAWAVNNVDALTQKINTTNTNLAKTDGSLATLSAAFEQTQDDLLQQIADLEAKITALKTDIEATKKNIPNRITYPQ